MFESSREHWEGSDGRGSLPSGTDVASIWVDVQRRPVRERFEDPRDCAVQLFDVLLKRLARELADGFTFACGPGRRALVEIVGGPDVEPRRLAGAARE
jgi:hypothetical protein